MNKSVAGLAIMVTLCASNAFANSAVDCLTQEELYKRDESIRKQNMGRLPDCSDIEDLDERVECLLAGAQEYPEFKCNT